MKKTEREKVWHEILHGEKILSEREAEEMEKIVKELRKEEWFSKKKLQ